MDYLDNLVFVLWVFMAWYLPKLEEGSNHVSNNPASTGVVKNLAQVYYQLGVLHESLMEHAKAAMNYREAIRINPKYAPAYFKLGKNYILANRYQNAIQPLEQAIGLNPEETTAHIYLGWVNNQLGRYEEAAESLKKALSFSAVCPSCKVRHRRFQNLPALPAQADIWESESDDAQKSASGHPVSFGNTSNQETESGRPISFGNASNQNAESGHPVSFGNTEENYPIRPTNRNNATSSGQNRKSCNPVENIMFDGISLVDAKLAVTFYRYGLSHIKLEEYFPAIMELTEAIRLDPEFSDAHYALGLAYERLGMQKEAVKEFISALKDKPGYHEAKFKLSEEMPLSELKELLPDQFEDTTPLRQDTSNHLSLTLKPRIPYSILISQN